jgi:hypothetical protein
MVWVVVLESILVASSLEEEEAGKLRGFAAPAATSTVSMAWWILILILHPA